MSIIDNAGTPPTPPTPDPTMWSNLPPTPPTPAIQDPIMQFFAWSHLPPFLQAVSKPFGEMAELIVDRLPRNPERTVALRKLLEAKDAAVRAMIYK